MQASGSSEGLVARAEHHCKYDMKGAMETADRVGKGRRVLGDSGGDPGMRQLKQQGTAGPQKDGCFSVDSPGQRGWAKNALHRSCRRPDGIKRKPEVVFGNQF